MNTRYEHIIQYFTTTLFQMPKARGFSSLLVKQRVQQYIEDHQDTAERAVTFGVRLDIELEAFEAWSILNPRGKRPSRDPEIEVKITEWLDRIDLFQVDPLDPDIDIGPMVGSREQELRQDIMPWLTKRKDSIYDPILRYFPELNEYFHEEVGTNYRIQSSLIRKSSITREINEVTATIDRLTKNSKIITMASPVHIYILQSVLETLGWTRSGPPWTRSGPLWTRSGPTPKYFFEIFGQKFLPKILF